MVDAKSHISANRPLVWVSLGIGIALGLIGYGFNWWDSVVWYDEVVHAYNGFAFTLWLGLWAYGAVLSGADKHPFGLVFTIVLLGLGLGGAWELLEWGRDHLLTEGNTVLGKMDTMWDLVLDSAGALVAALVVLHVARD